MNSAIMGVTNQQNRLRFTVRIQMHSPERAFGCLKRPSEFPKLIHRDFQHGVIYTYNSVHPQGEPAKILSVTNNSIRFNRCTSNQGPCVRTSTFLIFLLIYFYIGASVRLFFLVRSFIFSPLWKLDISPGLTVFSVG